MSVKILMQRTKRKAFAKTPRSRKKITGLSLGDFINYIRLVEIDEITLDQFAKRLYADW